MEISRKELARTATGMAIASAVVGVSAYMTTKLFLDAATDREEPRLIRFLNNKIRSSDSKSEASRIRQEASERLAAQEGEEVTVTAFDGLRLVAHWIPQAEAKRIVVAVHGWRTSWHRDFGMVSDFLRESGCSVLYIEQRGQGSSDGEEMSFGGAERFDCLTWANWIHDHVSDILPIYLYGISMGASSVMMASSLALPGNVKGIIADCGFTSPDEIWEYVAKEKLHVLYRPRKVIARRMFESRDPANRYDASAEEALASSKVPVLFIHGTADRFVPVEMTYRNYLACTAPKRLLIVPGASHAKSYFTDPQSYEKAMVDFWNEF